MPVAFRGPSAHIMSEASSMTSPCAGCREINLDDELSTARREQEGETAQAPLKEVAEIKNWGVAMLAGVMEISLVQCLNTFLRYAHKGISFIFLVPNCVWHPWLQRLRIRVHNALVC